MDFKRVKTILIVVLAAVNIALASWLTGIIYQDRDVSQRSDDQVVALLAERNIVLDKKKIPDTAGELPNCQVERMLDGDEKKVSKLLGGQYQKAADGSYVNGSKTLVISGDSFRLSDTRPEKPLSARTPEAVEAYCVEAMQEMGISTDNYFFSGMNAAGDNVKAIFISRFGKYDFFDANLEFELSDQGLVSVQGKNLIAANTVTGTKTDIFAIRSILVDFVNNPRLDTSRQTVIASIQLGYYIGHDAEQYKSVMAIPVWQIATEQGQIFYYDARNGKLLSD